MTAIDVDGIVRGIASHLEATGLFGSVSRHEPKNPPPNWIDAAVFANELQPSLAGTGLSVTSALVTVTVRVYLNALAEPLDQVDADLANATVQIIRDLSADFTLGGLIDYVDLLGDSGVRLGARWGYVQVGNLMYRISDILVPCVVFDTFPQAP